MRTLELGTEKAGLGASALPCCRDSVRMSLKAPWESCSVNSAGGTTPVSSASNASRPGRRHAPPGLSVCGPPLAALIGAEGRVRTHPGVLLRVLLQSHLHIRQCLRQRCHPLYERQRPRQHARARHQRAGAGAWSRRIVVVAQWGVFGAQEALDSLLFGGTGREGQEDEMGLFCLLMSSCIQSFIQLTCLAKSA